MLSFRRLAKSALILGAVTVASAALSGCADSKYAKSNLNIASDFGRAVRQDMAAQIADPDAHYTGAQISDARHAARAVARYSDGEVKAPDTLSTK